MTLKKSLLILVAIVICVSIVGLVMISIVFFEMRSLAFLTFSNRTGGDVNIEINGDKYTIKKRTESLEILFPLSDKVRVKIISPNIDISGDTYCELVHKPFGQCAFEIRLREAGIFCDECFAL